MSDGLLSWKDRLAAAEFGGIDRVEDAVVVALAIRQQFPEATMVPVIRVFPVVAVDDRENADAFNRDTTRAGLLHLVGNLADPLRAAYADMARLTEKERAAIASPDFRHHLPYGSPAGIARLDFPADAPVRFLDFAVVVEVHPDDVEVFRIPAEFG